MIQLTDEQMEHLVWIRSNFRNRRVWRKKDYEDFYYRDVKFLCGLIDNLQGKDIIPLIEKERDHESGA